jgi:hypothetical protein
MVAEFDIVFIHAVFPSRRGLLPSVRALIDFLAQRFEILHKELTKSATGTCAMNPSRPLRRS